MCYVSLSFLNWAENIQVQERALKIVPGLCESIDYAEVQGVLFPRVAVCLTWLSLWDDTRVTNL